MLNPSTRERLLVNAQIESRTAAATKARMRISEEKFANRLRDRGWICIAPGSDMHKVFTRAYLDDEQGQ